MRLGTRQTRYAPVKRECGRSLAESRRLTGPAGDIMLAARSLFAISYTHLPRTWATRSACW